MQGWILSAVTFLPLLGGPPMDEVRLRRERVGEQLLLQTLGLQNGDASGNGNGLDRRV